MMRYKIEIIDNQIGDYYELVLFVWKKRKWGSKEEWNLEYAHTLGKKYMCPQICKGRITVDGMFNEEVENVLKKYKVEEIHKITIQKG